MSMTPIAIIAIIAWAIVSIVRMIVNKSKTSVTQNETQHLSDEIVSLKERVATLEKIVTDERHDLRKEIDDL